jgi:hypothetical protein
MLYARAFFSSVRLGSHTLPASFGLCGCFERLAKCEAFMSTFEKTRQCE